MESTLYGTNCEADTDGDGLDDGCEIENGLDPLDTGEPCITIGAHRWNARIYQLQQ